jgi:hypothetical protein
LAVECSPDLEGVVGINIWPEGKFDFKLTTYDKPIPAADQRKRVRQPSRSTSRAPLNTYAKILNI